MREIWQNGAWVSERRTQVVCLLLIAATILSYAILLIGAHGTLDAMGRPIGTDFSNVYAAGVMADQGRAAAAWIWPDHYAVQQAIHGAKDVPFYGWHYPPPFLLIAAPLALLPYLAALALWQAATLGAAVATATRIAPGRATILAALAAPATFVCLGHGQNAFLTASLLSGGLWLLDRRPIAAGLLLGCLAYKPQFALLLPVVLLAAGEWRAFAGAAAASLTLVAATMLLWGWPVWQAFIDSLPLTQHIIIENGATGWEKIQSPFAAIRQWGGSIPAAYVVQGLVTAIAIGIAALVARRGTMEVRGAAALSAALLCTPYVLDYDYVLLGMAIAFVAADMGKRGMLGWERSWLAYAWMAPLFGRAVSEWTHVPVNLIAAIAVLALAMRRAILLDGALAYSLPGRTKIA